MVINETVPANTTFNAAASTAGWTCAAGSPAGTLCSYTVGNLAAGATGTVNFAVTVANPLPAGTAQVVNTATIGDDGANGTDPTPGDNTSSDATPVQTTPGLALAKSDNGATVTPGGTVAYLLTYRNTGNVGLTGIVLSETVPANTTFNAAASNPVWSCANGSPAGTVCTLPIGNLAAGASGTATFAVTVVSPVPAGTSQLANSATVSAAGGTTATNSDTTPVNVTPDLALTKSDGGATVTPGATVPYQLTYTNVGNIDLTGVVINETVPANTTFNAAASTAGWTCANTSPAGTLCTLAVGSVAAGATGTATFAVTAVTPFPAGATQLLNTATVSDDGTNGPDATPGDNTGSDTTPVILAPSLSLTKSDGGVIATPGAVVPYVLTYANTGNVDLTGVVINETVPANTTFNAAASTAGWTCANASPAGTSCAFTVGSLAAGATGSVTFAVTIANPLPAGTTQLTNIATITDSGGTTTTGGDTTPVQTTPGLSISKSDGGTTALPGGTVPYVLSYANTGNIDLTGVVINETVPANTTFNAAASTAGWSCANASPAGTPCSYTVGNLNAGVAGSVTFAVTVANPFPANTAQLSNSVTITASGGSTATNTDTTPVQTTPGLSLTKSDGGTTAQPAGTVIYTLSYQNTGNVDLTNVVINETVPTNTTFNAAASTAGWSCAAGSPAGTSCTFTVGNLAAGVAGSVTFAATVVNPFPVGAPQLSNSATITDGTTSTTTTDTTPVQTAPGLVINKTDNNAVATPGGTVNYVLTFQNTGNVNLTGVILTEQVPANTLFSAGSTPGWSCPAGSPAGTVCTLAVGNLGAGASGTATFAVTVVTPFRAGVTQLSNAVIIRDSGGTTATNSDTTPVNVTADYSVVKTDGGTTTTPGSTVPYQLTYRNTGNVDLTGVVLNETVPANTTFNAAASTPGWTCAAGSPAGTACSFTIGNLAAGAAGTVTFAVTAAASFPAGSTQLLNTVTITDDGANGPDPTPGDNTSTDTTPVTLTPGLSLVKSDGGITAQPGSTVPYILTYRNTGNVNLTGVRLTETVPANTTFSAAASTAGWSCPDGSGAGTVCTLIIGSLPVGATGSATFAVTVANPVPAGTTSVANTATLTDSGGTTTTGTDTTPVQTTPGLAISKSDGGVTTTPGGTVAYVLTYRNTGNVGLTGVVINETVPANTTFNAAASSTGWSCAAGSPAGTACTLTLGNLAAGAAGSVTFAVTVASPFPAGTPQLTNSVTITASNGSTATNSDTTPVQATPGLSLDKTDSGTTVQPGGTVSYILRYRNTGNVALTNVVINETVPANTIFNAAASTPGWSCANASPAGTACTFTVGNLPAGPTVGTTTFAVTVINPVPAGTTQLANSAIIHDSSGTTSGGSDTTPVQTTPGLTINKSDGGLTVAPGSTVNYTLSFANTGNIGLTGVLITEQVPANTTFNAAASSGGWSCANGSAPGTACVLTIGNLPAGASGSATFAVTVSSAVPAGTTQIANSVVIHDGGGNTSTNTDTTPVAGTPDLRITKSDGGTVANFGSVVAYALNYVNAGNVGLTAVVLNETVPANTTFNAASSSASWSCPTGSPGGTRCTLAVGSLAAGATGTATFAVTIPIPFPTGVSQIANTVVIRDTASTTADPTPGDNTATDTTPLNPTAIVLTSFTASQTGGGVTVRWATSSEINTWGFHLVRSATGRRADAVQVTAALIPGQGRGTAGATYTWADPTAVAGQRYSYWLQEVELSGAVHEYGPASSSQLAAATARLYLPVALR